MLSADGHAVDGLGATWIDVHAALSDPDRAAPLRPEELELLATSAYLLGRHDDYLRGLERAHRGHLDAGDPLRAARCAVWLAVHLAIQGEVARARGWYGRARRLAERADGDCVERGYLLLPLILQHEAAGAYEPACEAAARASAIAERFGDADLLALALQEQGRILFRLGRIAEGVGLLDEAMMAATAGELSPIVTGLVFCSAIDGCLEVFELGRAREWAAALTEWCERRPEMVAFTGRRQAQRAQITQLSGAWPEALAMNPIAAARCGDGAGAAFYRQGELHRLRGEFAAAETAFREASRCGWEPHPGLALLRLAQGNPAAAEAAIRRVVGEASEWVKRVALLPAYVEIMLAVGDLREATEACVELEAIVASRTGGMMAAMSAQAQGAVLLADGDAQGALVTLRGASRIWQELEAPYEAARVRVLVGLACGALGDHDAAMLELEAARGVFAELGAAPDVARADTLLQRATPIQRHGLTARESQVLRLVAAGETNRAIAGRLVLSEKTVERHLSNIFVKLRVSSRSAATAFAYEHQLIAPQAAAQMSDAA